MVDSIKYIYSFTVNGSGKRYPDHSRPMTAGLQCTHTGAYGTLKLVIIP